jgi:hypothetical protein
MDKVEATRWHSLHAIKRKTRLLSKPKTFFVSSKVEAKARNTDANMGNPIPCLTLLFVVRD